MNLNDLVVPGVRSLQPYQPGKPVEELAVSYTHLTLPTNREV